MGNVVFLPGIVAPAALRYAALHEHLPDIDALAKDLEVYSGGEPPAGYSIETEVAGLDRAADESGLDRFHLYGHSGGGAVALAYAAQRPERVLSLAVDEPASDFTADGDAEAGWEEIDAAAALPPTESLAAFLRLQLAPGVEPPPPPEGTPPPWMAKRPAGIRAFAGALRAHRVDEDRYRGFGRPVLYTHGTLSHPRWGTMAKRLGALFPDFRAELFVGLHHLHTSHQAAPARVAALLREHWTRAEAR